MSAGQGRLREAHADDYVTDLFAANKEKNNLDFDSRISNYLHNGSVGDSHSSRGLKCAAAKYRWSSETRVSDSHEPRIPPSGRIYRPCILPCM